MKLSALKFNEPKTDSLITDHVDFATTVKQMTESPSYQNRSSNFSTKHKHNIPNLANRKNAHSQVEYSQQHKITESATQTESENYIRAKMSFVIDWQRLYQTMFQKD